ncbi:C1 family peptidase [Legionella londiniensis]|uniref:Cysteine protease n=1 Tax=Legionella londiniensis TaxID=45068 RepID=A0A0W0VPA2_9GAMM|nr:C1 family peptidase [Legionella londiniensis]KTD21789.1 cysteine protease [Legionella londiniensis]STX92165.1 cysteine protease, papain C1 family [Legionella londiniensis]
MKISRLCYLAMFAWGGAFANNDIQIVGEIKQTVTVPGVKARSALSAPAAKEIALMKIQLSDSAKQTFKHRLDVNLRKDKALFTNGTSNVQLGMNGVPVLDQGNHGSCVTFANTAAIDAVLNKGDYLSQLCQLQLGRHFENNAYSPSGWNGSFGHIVLNQMEMFGLVSKENQRAHGCGGLTEYPLNGEDPETEISLLDYHQISEPMPDDMVAWSPVLDVYQAVLQETDTDKVLEDVKKALRQGDRMTFGVLLVDFHLGVAGAVGKHNALYDSWVLTPEIIDDINHGAEFGGHEMVITGYDDNAVAIDDHGREHRGLLTLRNSWGDRLGDRGDFYMSYDYFRNLVIEAQRIRNLQG